MYRIVNCNWFACLFTRLVFEFCILLSFVRMVEFCLVSTGSVFVVGIIDALNMKDTKGRMVEKNVYDDNNTYALPALSTMIDGGREEMKNNEKKNIFFRHSCQLTWLEFQWKICVHVSCLRVYNCGCSVNGERLDE